MKAVVFGGAAAALAGLIFGAGMKAPISVGDLPQPELQQVSYPVETLSQEDFRPDYVVAAGYAPSDWASPQPQLWRTAYEPPAAEEAAPAEFTADLLRPAQEPSLTADDQDFQGPRVHAAEADMPYTSGMTTQPDAEQAPQARPASSWPNKRGDTKQQVFNSYDGFEHVAPANLG